MIASKSLKYPNFKSWQCNIMPMCKISLGSKNKAQTYCNKF